MKTKITVNPASLKKLKNKSVHPVIFQVRVYLYSTIIRFRYYVHDVDLSPIKLTENQLNKGVIINHNKAIRYNSLLPFIIEKIKLFTNECITNTNSIKVEEIRAKVKELVVDEFDYEFIKLIDNQKIEIDTEYYGKIKVSKEVLESFNKITTPIQPELINDEPEDNFWEKNDIEGFLISEQAEFNNEQERISQSKLETKVRFQKGYFDQNNIFELFASIKHRPDIDNTYNKIIIRLYEYRFFEQPLEQISSLDVEWITEFFKFLWTTGYSSVSTINFDPLKFDGSIFINKNKNKYQPQSFIKLYSVFFTVCKKLLPKNIFKNIDFENVDVEKICGEKKAKKGSHLNENLTNGEFNELFFYRFKSVELGKYQKIFTSYTKKKKLKLRIEDLEIARDMFCLSVMAGGLRGFKDLQTLNFDSINKQLFFYADKKDEPMQTPLNVYTEIIAKDYDNHLPTLGYEYSLNTINMIYRHLLRAIGEIIPLSRKIISNKEIIMLKEAFLPKTARKTFSQIMYDIYNFSTDEISIFTGHDLLNENVLTASYLNTKSFQKKKKLFERIKLPKGKTKNAVRTRI